jgi:monoamine oxidase
LTIAAHLHDDEPCSGVVYGTVSQSPATQPLEVFGFLVHGPAARSYHLAPRDLRLRELLSELDKLWPGFSGYVRSSHVYTYHPLAIPGFPAGRSPLDEGTHLLRAVDQGLYLAGDYLYNAHSDGAVKSAMDAAKRIAAELAR